MNEWIDFRSFLEHKPNYKKPHEDVDIKQITVSSKQDALYRVRYNELRAPTQQASSANNHILTQGPAHQIEANIIIQRSMFTPPPPPKQGIINLVHLTYLLS